MPSPKAGYAERHLDEIFVSARSCSVGQPPSTGTPSRAALVRDSGAAKQLTTTVCLNLLPWPHTRLPSDDSKREDLLQLGYSSESRENVEEWLQWQTRRQKAEITIPICSFSAVNLSLSQITSDKLQATHWVKVQKLSVKIMANSSCFPLFVPIFRQTPTQSSGSNNLLFMTMSSNRKCV